MAMEATSISKCPEKLSESPSSIRVVTAEEIPRRGFQYPEAQRLDAWHTAKSIELSTAGQNQSHDHHREHGFPMPGPGANRAHHLRRGDVPTAALETRTGPI
jgi:hypothetical protein